jgi:hypothetical protein
MKTLGLRSVLIVPAAVSTSKSICKYMIYHQPLRVRLVTQQIFWQFSTEHSWIMFMLVYFDRTTLKI